MKLVRSTVVVALAAVWLLSLSVVSFVDEMRTLPREERGFHPISIVMFLLIMAASVLLVGFTGAIIALLKNY